MCYVLIISPETAKSACMDLHLQATLWVYAAAAVAATAAAAAVPCSKVNIELCKWRYLNIVHAVDLLFIFTDGCLC